MHLKFFKRKLHFKNIDYTNNKIKLKENIFLCKNKMKRYCEYLSNNQ